ncbi:3-phenylpropionate dioxygenase ferredoxin--NAD(+) reductase component [Escherichia coli]|uniref:3-phenylpropionate dioxygenase ferredoxin--NAD(+) reductase component n=1 Tax=Escherichia coli TaxID=562 RepID=A0A376NTL7_ECOLX|nr:3-phenylpropionate dioxygenase ferredoxin--NAD(+) reductase component [Escherichia coli]
MRILLNNAIEHVVDDEKVELTLQSGETLQADVVIYGIGISANDQLAREANLDTANGIVIDEACRTCDPAIFAGGDVAITRLIMVHYTAAKAGETPITRRKLPLPQC